MLIDSFPQYRRRYLTTTDSHLRLSTRYQKMTLDVTSFIDAKGGNSEEIRESQRKRGHSVEIVDEVIQMYQDWVKSTSYDTQSSSTFTTFPSDS